MGTEDQTTGRTVVLISISHHIIPAMNEYLGWDGASARESGGGVMELRISSLGGLKSVSG